MDRFAEYETFVAVAETGGFNAAARRLGTSPPRVSRLVAALEARIGTRLFTRTTRQVAPTEAGERLFRDMRRLLEEMAAAEGSAAGAHRAPQGVLSVTAPAIFGRLHVAPLVREFLDLHPQVTARMLFVDRVVNLIEEGLDVAVRIGELPDSSLTAVRVGHVRHAVVAAPAYLARHGVPERPEALAGHRIAAAGPGGPVRQWRFVGAGGVRTVPVAPALEGNAIDAALDAAERGWAITRVLSYQAAAALAEGRLVELLAGYETREVPVHLVHAEGVLGAAKIRAFVDHAARALRRAAPAWTAMAVAQRGGAKSSG